MEDRSELKTSAKAYFLLQRSVLLSILLILITYHLRLTAEVGAHFLKIGIGARSMGLGGAYVGLSDDITSLYWNPAGLRKLKTKEFGFMHTKWVLDTKYEFAGIGIPLNNKTIGLGIMYLDLGEIEGRSEEGIETGSFRASDFCFTISGAKRISNRIDLGATIKFIQQKIEKEEAKGVAVDIGVKCKVKGVKGDLGLVIKNIGPEMKFIDEPYNLPLTISLGGGYNFLGNFVISLDINHEIYDDKTSISMGIEYRPVRFISLRAGYLYKLAYQLLTYQNSLFQEENKIFDFNGLSGGFGLNFSNYILDYSLIPYKDLGLTHRLSFKIKF